MLDPTFTQLSKSKSDNTMILAIIRFLAERCCGFGFDMYFRRYFGFASLSQSIYENTCKSQSQSQSIILLGIQSQDNKIKKIWRQNSTFVYEIYGLLKRVYGF